MDMLCFIFWSQDYLNWLTTDILQLFCLIQILTVGVGKGHYFQSIHTCLFQSRVQTGYWSHRLPHDSLEDDILSRTSSVVRVSAGSIQVNLSLSICAERCMHTNFTLPPPSPNHHFLYCTTQWVVTRKVLAKKQLTGITTKNMYIYIYNMWWSTLVSLKNKMLFSAIKVVILYLILFII